MPVKISADIQKGDNLARMIDSAAQDSGLDIQDGDIIVVSQKIVSKAEGRVVDLSAVKPSKKASQLGKSHHKDPRLVQVILRESRKLIRARSGILITETPHGFVCANSGVDQSNAPGESFAILLPINPDNSAYGIKNDMQKLCRKVVAVLIADTFGRPFRNGQTNVAIGIAGMEPIMSYVGSHDMYGRMLRVTEIAIADEIASAAELVMGKKERIPVAIVRGYKFIPVQKASIQPLLRTRKKDLFR